MGVKTIGLIGGMSWESTVTYYQIINEVIKSKLGGSHSAKILLYSVDFHEIEECLVKQDWDKGADILTHAAKALELGGADFIAICTNTLHKVVPLIEQHISIPILHIADATADELEKNNIKTIALLGTKYTMTQDFYKDRLLQRGFEVIIPEEKDIEVVNSVIFNELCMGVIKQESKNEYIRIINSLADRGAQGAILGCTEIGLLVQQKDTAVNVFDTTEIHATRAALMALGE
jgi:aspartate racemase